MPALISVRALAPAILLAAGTLMAGRALAVPPEPVQGSPETSLCVDPPGPVALGSAEWNGWGRGVDNTRYQPEPAIRAFDVQRLALKWAFGYPGSSAAGQPVIVDGRVFVASAAGRVYSLDSKTGCTYWTYDAQAGVRTALSIAEFATPKMPRPKKSKRRRTNAHVDMPTAPGAAFFGDDKGAVYALDAEKGTLLWKTQVDAHPLARIQASPTLYQGRLFVAVGSSENAEDPAYACCTFRGSVAALDIATGRVLWKTYTVSDEPRPFRPSSAGVQQFGPAGAPIAGAPTVDASRGLLYVATGVSFNPSDQPLAGAIVALDLADGRLRWVKKPAGLEGDPAEFDSSAILRNLASGKEVILAGQTSGFIYSLDPDRQGDILWQVKASEGKSPEGVQGGGAADYHSLYVALAGLAPEASEGPSSLTALDIRTGSKHWHTTTPTPACSWGGGRDCPHAQVQPVTVIPGAAFSGSMDGHLRAYSTIDGKILWDFDTAKDFTTVNRVKASGGSLAGGGAAIVNGVVYVNSGGGQGHPGNVLLAFSVDGK
jgi:polyvinyl alcohol dehydrogenase (cytochrome)